MTTPEKKIEKKPEEKPENLYAGTKTPHFMVTQAPGFMTGSQGTIAPGEVVAWEKPDGWNEEKYGKHFSDYGPSTTFKPLNEAAEKLMVSHKENIRKKLEKVKGTQGAIDEELKALLAENSKKIAELQAQVVEQGERFLKLMELLAEGGKRK